MTTQIIDTRSNRRVGGKAMSKQSDRLARAERDYYPIVVVIPHQTPPKAFLADRSDVVGWELPDNWGWHELTMDEVREIWIDDPDTLADAEACGTETVIEVTTPNEGMTYMRPQYAPTAYEHAWEAHTHDYASAHHLETYSEALEWLRDHPAHGGMEAAILVRELMGLEEGDEAE